MKSIATILSLLVITGCSMTPKVGDKSGADYPITLKANSSPALTALSKTPIKGVRDLSIDEFEDESVTVKEFEELNSEVDNPMSSEAYALGSVAVGASLGLAFKYASGIGILGYLASDDRAENYEFSDDFNSKGYIYSSKGGEELFDDLVSTIPDAMLSFNEKVDAILNVGIDKEIWSHSVKAGTPFKGAGDSTYRNSTESIYESIGIVSNAINGKRVSTEFYVSLHCESNLKIDAVCAIKTRFRIDKNPHPLVSLLVKEIAKVMSEGSLMYLPPRKDLNRIPMVYKTDGEPMYLVEKNRALYESPLVI